MTEALLVGIVFLATVLQTTSGFGFALMAMPMVSLVVGVRAAAPLVAMAGFTLYAVNLVRYHRSLNRQELLRLAVPTAIGVPVGIWMLSNLPEQTIKTALGVVLIVYALYAVARPQARPVVSDLWAYPVGFVAGCLGGAFNTPGPPVVVYGDLKHWPRDEFRSLLQALFLGSSALVIAGHAAAGHITPTTWRSYALIVPFLLLGIVVGSAIDRRLNGDQFRRLVVAMILATGVLLIV